MTQYIIAYLIKASTNYIQLFIINCVITNFATHLIGGREGGKGELKSGRKVGKF